MRILQKRRYKNILSHCITLRCINIFAMYIHVNVIIINLSFKGFHIFRLVLPLLTLYFWNSLLNWLHYYFIAENFFRKILVKYFVDLKKSVYCTSSSDSDYIYI